MQADFQFIAADQVAPADLHAAFGAAFADYLLGPFGVDLAAWPGFLARQAVDLARSRVVLGKDGVAAFQFTAQRPDVRCWRLATMGARPAARGTGAAAALLDDFIARARDAGQQWAELECFAQNERALRLYRSRGFEDLHALHGWRGSVACRDDDAAAEIDLDAAFCWLDEVGRRRGDLPLQVTPVCLRALPPTARAWRRGRAQVIASTPGEQRVVVHSLVDDRPAQEDAERLVAALQCAFADHTLHVPQLQRDDVGGAALQRLGLERLALYQLMLRRAL